MVKQYSLSRTFTHLLAVFLILLPAVSFGVQVDEEASFLPAEKVFILKAKRVNHEAILNFEIAPGYLLYQQYLKVQSKSPEGTTHDIKIAFPPAIMKHDPILGDYQVYTNQVEIKVPVEISSVIPDLLITYQGCSKAGFCYAPQNKLIHFSEEGLAKITDVEPAETVSTTESILPVDTTTELSQTDTPKTVTAGSESDRVTELLQSKNIPLTLLIFFGLGILLAFTPCVLPMVPIMANILVGAEKPLATRRAIFLASIYVFSVAICYASAGVIVGFLGNKWQLSLQQPPFLIGLSLLLILFALSQFNLISIRVPQFLSGALHNLERRQKQGSALGAFGMGIISALMASPCVTPALVGALTYISQTGNALLGGLALFVMSLGMGFPLLIVACLGSRYLPKAGRWMVTVKNITGVLLIVLAGTILMRAIPDNILQTKESKNDTSKIEFVSIQSPAELTKILTAAKKDNKKVILDVYAKWCVSCQRMDHSIFENPETKNIAANYQFIRLDITTLTKEIEQLLSQLKIIGPPTVLFFDSFGQEIKNLRLVGEVNKSEFFNHLTEVDKLIVSSQSASN